MHNGSTITDLNRKDREHRTPLHYAAIGENVDCVELLFALDANIEIKDRDGKTPKDLISPNRGDIMLLFAFKKLLQLCPEFTYADYSPYETNSYLSLETLQVNTEPNECRVARENIPFTWLHIPWTNRAIVLAALRQFERQLEFPFLRSFSSILNPNIPSLYKSSFESYPRVEIVFPCLQLQTKDSQTLEREKIRALRDAMTPGFPKDVIQYERTLDETYYPGLHHKILDARNRDQVVSRERPEPSGHRLSDDMQVPILMVPKLWLWRIDKHVLTAYSNVSKIPEVRPTTRSKIRDADAYYTFQDPTNLGLQAYTQASGIGIGLIIAQCISQFGKPQARSRFNPPLDYYETGVVRILSDVEAYTDPDESSPPDGKKDHMFMHRIADIREELVMIQEVLRQQREILLKLIEDVERFELPKAIGTKLRDEDPTKSKKPESHLDGYRETEEWEKWEEVKLSVLRLDEYQTRINKIDRDAERVEKVIQDQLNLKRTYASISDARTGLILSAAVIGLTIITIIFAPIAFMATLFALPLDNLLGNQVQVNGPNGASPTAAYTQEYVIKWFVAAELVSLAVTIFLVLLCLWLFGGIGNFGAMWKKGTKNGEHPRNTSTEWDEAVSVGDKKGPEPKGLRRRFARLRGVAVE
ncbi:hypothetical protein F4820DRAFT_443385 [Hypoxylon rubiginosum]|uniref:Uncharacterized protein n=1 Tax=Hypoxylon rubiginosum TaxID=110542 RepID=A0ACB9ZFZ3_9PEZI|nr:hypothetical protein F4820DRAFT_443385 [Hypoxylon rubiginosum]